MFLLHPLLQELLSLEERLGNVNRGASQDVIEQNTLPYKYCKVKRPEQDDDQSEKCTICLSEFEEEEDVRSDNLTKIFCKWFTCKKKKQVCFDSITW